MKKDFKVLGLFFVLVVFAMGFGQVHQEVLKSYSSKVISEVQASGCLGATYIKGKKPQTAAACYCSGSEQWVTPQTCVSGNGGCTEISCSGGGNQQ